MTKTQTSTEHVHCECGTVMGERCTFDGPRAETVVIEVMPRSLRDSHTAAGNRGSYPANGADRLRVHRDCADQILNVEGDWAAIVSE